MAVPGGAGGMSKDPIYPEVCLSEYRDKQETICGALLHHQLCAEMDLNKETIIHEDSPTYMERSYPD